MVCCAKYLKHTERPAQNTCPVPVTTRPNPRTRLSLPCAHDDSEARPIHVAVSTRVSAEAKSMFHSGGSASGSSA
jgi:hypothetical protein